MATDNPLRDIIQNQQRVTRGLGNPTGNIDAARIIADIVGRRRDLSEILANQNLNIGFANTRQLEDARNQDASNRNRGVPVGTSTNPLTKAIGAAKESKAAVGGSGFHIPGQGLIAAALQPAKQLAEFGLHRAGWGLKQLARVDDSVKAGLYGTIHAMNTDKQSFGEALDDFFLGAGRNFRNPGSVPVGGGEIYNELHDLVPGWEATTNFADKLIPGTPGDVKWGSPSTWPTLLHPERLRDVIIGGGIDVAAAPSSYISLGATSVLEPGSKAAIDAVGKAGTDAVAQLSHVPTAGRNVIKEAATRNGMKLLEDEMDVIQSGARRGVKKLPAKVVEQKITNQVERASEAIVKDAENWGSKYKKWLDAGKKGPRPKMIPEYQQIYDAAKMATDYWAANAGRVISKTEQALELSKNLRNGFSQYAKQFVPDMRTAVEKTWEPILRRKINPRIGFLGRGADLGKGRLAEALPESLTNWLDPVLEAGYKPIAKTGEAARKFEIVKQALNTFSTGEHFPGFANKIRQMTKASGVRDFENAMSGKHGEMPSFIRYATNAAGKTQAVAKVTLKPFQEIFAGVDDDLAKEIYTALEEGRVMTGVTSKGVPLAQIQSDVKDWLEYINKQRLDTGMQHASETVDDFLPVSHKRAWKKEAQDQARKFKAERQFEAHNTQQIIKNTAKNAAVEYPALKFNRDIRTVMSEYIAKHQRDMVRLNWQTEMLNRFGVASSKMTPEMAKALDLVKVEGKHIPRALKTAQSGLTHYMSKDMARVFDSWENLFRRSTSSLEETQSWLNAAEQANKAWKISATIARPSFQLRNFLGDVSTGWLDQVPSWKYGRWAKAKAEGPAATLFEEAGRKYSVQYLEDNFMKRAGSSTFFNTGALARDDGTGFINRYMDFNEARENLPRKVHYSTAFEDEMRASAKKYRAAHGGNNPIGKALGDMEEKAHQAALTRVNKFKFDYSDLTPFEAKVMKNFVPFYTFQKKAAQMVLENALLSPGRMNAFNKALGAIQANLSGDPNESWMQMNQVTIPAWAKDMGFVPLSPLGESGDVFGLNPSILPQYSLNQTLAASSGQNQDIFRNLIGQVHPLIRLPFELAAGQDLGTGLPRGSSPESLTSYLPPASVIGKGANLLGLAPVGKALAGKASTEKGNLLTLSELIGLPFQNVTEKQRVYAAKDYQDPYDTTVTKVNKQLESAGVEVKTVTRTVDGQKVRSYRVQSAEIDPETGNHQVYQEFEDRASAYAFAVRALKK